MFDTIAIDWGSLRTGLAFASSTTGLVIPHLQECLTPNLLDILKKEIKERKIQLLVIGIPTNFHWQPTETGLKILDFIEELRTIFVDIKIETVNERGTTQAAQNLSLNHGRKLAKDELNHQAACQIFELYYSLHHATN
jgi:putative holliday junction resolvase